MKKYWKVWILTAQNTLQQAFINRWSNALFFLGKVMRFGFSMLFLFIIRQHVTQFAGYTTDQLIIFFLTYQFVDLLAQVVYRGVYVFSNYIRTGDFDFVLAQPINPLFRMLTNQPDINDTLFLIPTLIISLYIALHLQVSITLASFIWFLVLLCNSFLIVTAFHILILCAGILITQVEGILWLYRDLSRLGQFPVSIYVEPLRFALFFLVPIGVMVTIPAEYLLGVIPAYSAAIAVAIGVIFFILSLRVWKYSIRYYSSASS